MHPGSSLSWNSGELVLILPGWRPVVDTAGGVCPCIHDQEIVFSPLPYSVDPGNICLTWLCEFVTAAPLRGHPFPFRC